MGLKQKDKRFQPPCLDSYGLNVSSHDPSSGVIVSVKCLFCENLVEKWMKMKNENKKNLKCEKLQITVKKWQYSKAYNRATWIEVCRIQAVDSWSKECFLPQMTPLFNPWMLPMLVWMCYLISQLLRSSLADFRIILIVVWIIWSIQSML